MVAVSGLTYKRLNQKIIEALRTLEEFQREDGKKHQSVGAGVSPDLDREKILQGIIVNLKKPSLSAKLYLYQRIITLFKSVTVLK